MNPFTEPNNFEKAVQYLDNFKDTHIVSDQAEEKLLHLLKNYYELKEYGSPVRASEKWIEVNAVLVTCKPKSDE